MNYKFRGLTIDTKKPVYGSLIQSQDNTRAFIGYVELLDDGGEVIIVHYDEVLPASVGLGTGLKDKNGKEIYEGDKMNFLCDKASPTGGHYCGTVGFHKENEKIVEWVEDGWYLGGFRLSTQLEMYEVTGSIHEEAKP